MKLLTQLNPKSRYSLKSHVLISLLISGIPFTHIYHMHTLLYLLLLFLGLSVSHSVHYDKQQLLRLRSLHRWDMEVVFFF